MYEKRGPLAPRIHEINERRARPYEKPESDLPSVASSVAGAIGKPVMDVQTCHRIPPSSLLVYLAIPVMYAQVG